MQLVYNIDCIHCPCTLHFCFTFCLFCVCILIANCCVKMPLVSGGTDGDDPSKEHQQCVKKKGTKRKRLAGAMASNPVQECLLQSCLALDLCLNFAWGVYSPQQVQHLASLACKDMDRLLSMCKDKEKPELQDLKKLAGLGYEGRHANNCHRDLLKMIGQASSLPKALEISVPMKGFTGLPSTYMFLPHEMFAAMYKSYYPAFKEMFCPSAEKCAEFWGQVYNHPAMVNHPIKKVEGWESFCIPISLHGDGTPITGRGKSWCKNMTIWSMASLLVNGSTKTSQVYLYSIFDKLIKTGAAGTVETAMEILAWSFYHLYLGIWPKSPYNSDVETLCCKMVWCWFVYIMFDFDFVFCCVFPLALFLIALLFYRHRIATKGIHLSQRKGRGQERSLQMGGDVYYLD